MSVLEDMKSEVQLLSRLVYVDTTTTVRKDMDEVGEEETEELLLSSSDPLVLALLVSSSTNLVLVLLYWLYLLYSSYSSSSSPKSLLFPHLLLLGLCLGSSSMLAQVSLEPSCLSSLLCPVSYSLIYSSLLARLVYLHSLHKGVYLPSLYQTLLLLFCVLVQVSLSTQLLLLSRDMACSSSSSPQTDLLSLAYPILLLLCTIGLSTLLRNTAEHYSEARSLWSASLLSTTSWLAWVSSGLIFGHHYQLIKCGYSSPPTCPPTQAWVWRPQCW